MPAEPTVRSTRRSARHNAIARPARPRRAPTAQPTDENTPLARATPPTDITVDLPPPPTRRILQAYNGRLETLLLPSTARTTTPPLTPPTPVAPVSPPAPAHMDEEDKDSESEDGARRVTPPPLNDPEPWVFPTTTNA